MMNSDLIKFEKRNVFQIKLIADQKFIEVRHGEGSAKTPLKRKVVLTKDSMLRFLSIEVKKISSKSTMNVPHLLSAPPMLIKG
mgnify:CR=1 FL=1